jgi:pimeloyl-[acyl-carrier protein] methyl ester esterase
MAKQIGFLAMHGWGYDRHFFDPLRACFPKAPFYALDRGYYGSPYTVDLTALSSEVLWVGLGHSMGFAYWLMVDHPCEVLVSIGGFFRFLQQGERPGQKPLALRKQIRYFQSYPSESLKIFMEKCGLIKNFKQLNTSILTDDLKSLSTLDVTSCKINGNVLYLHGMADEIVTYETLLDQCASDQAVIRTHPTAPHALGSLESRWCADQIVDFLKKQNQFSDCTLID